MQAPHRFVSAKAWGCLVAMFLLGGCMAADASDMSAAPRETASARPSLTPHSQLWTYRSTRTHRETPAPVRLRIPEIGVDTELKSLGLASGGSIEVPQDPDEAGWWVGGPRPGQVGPAVILGHVDSQTGPAVFYRLHRLQRGDEVLVDRADGTTTRFEVTAEGTYRQTAFPRDLVYHPTVKPELRLVTCTTFDRATGDYRDNLVVFAAQAS